MNLDNESEDFIRGYTQYHLGVLNICKDASKGKLSRKKFEDTFVEFFADNAKKINKIRLDNIVKESRNI